MAKTEQKPRQEVALQPSRLPINKSIAEEYGVTSPQWRVLVDQIFPSAKTVEAVLMALEYCRSRHLDIFKRPVHIVPMYSSQLKRMVETVWPGISEIRTTAARTGMYGGMDPMVFGPDITETFEGEVMEYDESAGRRVGTKATKTVTYPEWVEVTVYKIILGMRVPWTLRTYWIEAYASIGKSGVPNDMWEKRPRGQLMKCGEAAVLRMAFPEELGGEYAAEEMEGKMLDVTPSAPRPSSGPPSSVQPVDEPQEAYDPPPADPMTRDQVDSFLNELDENLAVARDEATLTEIFDAAQVETNLAGNEDALEWARDIHAKHLKRMNTQG